MDKTEILLIVNSVLLGVVSILYMVVGYFLKDLHKDFKQLIERVNHLYTDLNSHISLFDRLSQIFQRQINKLSERLREIENKTKNEKK